MGKKDETSNRWIMDRRGFLGLATTVAAGLLVGCGDDGAGVGDDDGTGTGTGTGDTTDGSTRTDTTASTAPDGTGSTGADATGDESGDADDTGESVCEPGGFEEVFDADAVTEDGAAFPLAIMAGEMKPTSALFSTWIPDAQTRLLRIWRPADAEGTVIVAAELEVTPDAAGYVKVPVDGLCAGTWYRYAYFTGEPGNFDSRSPIAEFRTAIDDDVLEPLTVALSSCNGSSLDWPALELVSDEYYDMFLHLGDMAYNDGAFTRAEFRESWRQYLGASGFRKAYARAGLYATWDDHEIDDDSRFDRETTDPMQLQKKANALDAYFEVLPIEGGGPGYKLWRSFRWGLTAEIIVLDCRYERRPSMGEYISQEQMDWLKDRLLNSPCHFKVIMNSVPITNMPLAWSVASNDRWEGFPDSRNELLGFINEHQIQNIWFVAGDFHVSFVSRLEPNVTTHASAIHEIAVTGGNQNPVPESILAMNPPQFSYGRTRARGLLMTFDPMSNAVNVRFIDPETGEDAYNESLTYG
jgi:phosphodiesterase/alkaline phosphatase D-like protein